METNEELADILVLSFQELDLSTEALLHNALTTKADMWVAAIVVPFSMRRCHRTRGVAGAHALHCKGKHAEDKAQFV